VSVPAVRAAIQRWFGYVPDVGLVSEGGLRVLAEPVSATRDGITLTVEKVVVDSAHTTVLYKVEGIPEDILDYHRPGPAPATPGCSQDGFLQLPTGELSPMNQDGTAWGTGYEHRASYAVIPAEIEEVQFVLPCIRFTLQGKAPEDWKLSLHLIPAPPEMTVFPVFEISTPIEVTGTAIPQPSSGFTTVGISLTLDRAVQMDDGYLLYATIHWANTGFNAVNAYDEMRVHVLDADGREIPFAFDYEALSNVEAERGQMPLAIKTAPIPVPGPLKVVIDAVGVEVDADARFSFDTGTNPVPGQVWELNQLVDLGHGQSLRVLRATYPTPPMKGWPQKAALSFEMESDTGISSATLTDPEHPLAPSGGGGGSSSGPFTGGFSYAGEFPAGPITVEILSVGLNLPGPWEAQWTPPVSEAQAAATPQPEACLNRESWQQALQARPPLPDGIGGTLAFFGEQPGDERDKVFLLNLAGGQPRFVGFGTWPALSPDGTRVAYTGHTQADSADGLYITDLLSDNTTRLPGTTTGDDAPHWSPDGTKLTFTRHSISSSGLIGAPEPYDVFVVNVDGSDLKQFTNRSDVSQALGWLPDGDHLLFSTSTPKGARLQIIDVRTGEVEPLFDGAASAVLSPDGKRLAFNQPLPLDKIGLFASNLDGSQRKLLASGHPYIALYPVWSPDGKWVIVTVYGQDSERPGSMLALIEVDTCQIIPLPNLSGYPSSWLP
ncbi:MAG TPA: hypothetical protein VLE49_13310, partial [Anaerolineales bacterium]|nr:hypothetical protein [Anaerolineales bacterium]